MTEKRIRRTAKDGRWFVGSCGVDSGQIIVLDPCYIKDQNRLADATRWQDFCDARFPDSKYVGEEPAIEMCAGVVTSTYCGDGEYPVYITTQGGSPKKMEIIFTRNTSESDEAKTIEYNYEDLEE